MSKFKRHKKLPQTDDEAELKDKEISDTAMPGPRKITPDKQDASGIPIEKETRVSRIYDIKRFDESDCSRFRKYCRYQKNKLRQKIKDPQFYLGYLYSRIPILDWLPKYKKKYAVPDMVAGLTVGVMNIPQGMAYSSLASLPAVNGLYISFFPLIIYALFGKSRHLAVGSYALVSLLTGTAINKMLAKYENALNQTTPLLHNETFANYYESEINNYKIKVAISLTFLVGVFQILLGMSGLGILTSYFSDTFISSYTCASAIHVIKSQIKDLLGLDKLQLTRYSGILNVPYSLIDMASHISTAHWQTIIISVVCMIYLIIFKELINPRIKKKIKVQFPSELLLVILATVVSYLFKFEEHGVVVVGFVPKGFPIPRVPDFTLWSDMISDAFIIALIAFSVSVSMSCLFARKHKYEIDSTQELYAYGITNLLSSFFLCYPSSGSLSRSSVLENTGGKTLVSSLFSAFILLFVILFMGPLFESLPNACLASIIVIAFKNILLQFKDLFRLWSINKFESVTWFITFFSVVLLDIDYGLAIGVGISIFLIVLKDQLFQTRNLSRYDDTTQYVDDNFIQSVTNTDTNVKIFKAQRSIYFVNCDKFQDQLYKNYGFSPIDRITDKKQRKDEVIAMNPNFTEIDADGKSIQREMKEYLDPDIILEFSAVNYVDTNGVKMLKDLIDDYKKVDVNVYICEAQDNFIEMLYRMKLLESLDDNIFVTVNDALRAIEVKRTNGAISTIENK